MKKIYLFLLAAAVLMASCEKTTGNEESLKATQEQTIPESDLKVLKQMGYDTRRIQVTEDGYIIDNTTMLTNAQLEEARASFINFQIKTDIPGMYLVDISKTYRINCVFNDGETPAWGSTRATATLVNQTETEEVSLRNEGKGVWSFQLSKPGSHLVTITINDGIHLPTTEQLIIQVNSITNPLYYKVVYANDTWYESNTIEFYSDPACTKRHVIKYKVECNFATRLWIINHRTGETQIGVPYSYPTLVIPAGESSYELNKQRVQAYMMQDVERQWRGEVTSIRYLR